MPGNLPVICLIGSRFFASDKRRVFCAAFNYRKLYLIPIVFISQNAMQKIPFVTAWLRKAMIRAMMFFAGGILNESKTIAGGC